VTGPFPQPTANHSQAGERTGFAQCVIGGCEQLGVLVEIPVRVDTMVQRAVDIPVEMTSTSYMVPLNDDDVRCPECGNPRALMLDKPPAYRPFV
jgi:DNA-directed RNA polymerase subunit RPC12/RpoP